MEKQLDWVENEQFMEKMDYAMTTGNVVYLRAVWGGGKSTAAAMWALKRRKRVQTIQIESQRDFDAIRSLALKSNSLYIIENLERLERCSDNMQSLRKKLENMESTTKIIITSRAQLPTEWKSLQMEGHLKIFDMFDMCFNYEMLAKYYEMHNLPVLRSELYAVLKNTMGHPFVIKTAVSYMESCEHDLSWVSRKVREDVFAYLDARWLSAFSEEEQQCMMYTASFQEFDRDIFQLLSERQQMVYQHIMEMTSFNYNDREGHYSVRPQVRLFLMYKQKLVMEQKDINEINEKLGNYYDRKNDVNKALYYMSLAENKQRMAEILERNAKENHVGVLDYYELRNYYKELDEKDITCSPALIASVSMIHSLCGDSETSEKYAHMLNEMLKAEKKHGDRYYEILKFDLYLAIALPHRGNINLPKYLIYAAKLEMKKGITAQPMSITGNMPSLMNGGKDFCSWSRHDTVLYALLAKSMDILFGESIKGLAQIGMGESNYERDEIGKALEYLSIGISKAEDAKSLELYFAGQAVMVKIMIAQGNLKSAYYLLTDIENKIRSSQAEYLYPNMKAFCVKQSLNTSQQARWERWILSQEAKSGEEFYYTKRYEYLLRIRIWIMQEGYPQALVLIERVLAYAKECSRKYIEMEANLLKALIYYKIENPKYQTIMQELIKTLESYGFIRLVADEGAAVWNMLNSLDIDTPFFKQLLEATQKQKNLYPNYMIKQVENSVTLTEREHVILKLLCKGMKNSEIAEYLTVTISAVKFHLANIYSKLGVNSRSAAIRTAMEQGW